MGFYIGLPIRLPLGLPICPGPLGSYGLFWAKEARDLITKFPIRSCLELGSTLMEIYVGSKHSVVSIKRTVSLAVQGSHFQTILYA